MNRWGVRLDPVDTWFFRDGRPFDAAQRAWRAVCRCRRSWRAHCGRRCWRGRGSILRNSRGSAPREPEASLRGHLERCLPAPAAPAPGRSGAGTMACVRAVRRHRAAVAGPRLLVPRGARGRVRAGMGAIATVGGTHAGLVASPLCRRAGPRPAALVADREARRQVPGRIPDAERNPEDSLSAAAQRHGLVPGRRVVRLRRPHRDRGGHGVVDGGRGRDLRHPVLVRQAAGRPGPPGRRCVAGRAGLPVCGNLLDGRAAAGRGAADGADSAGGRGTLCGAASVASAVAWPEPDPQAPRAMWLLASPGIYRQTPAWLPDAIPRGHLRAAASRDPQAVSGWDVARRAPRGRRVLPCLREASISSKGRLSPAGPNRCARTRRTWRRAGGSHYKEHGDVQRSGIATGTPRPNRTASGSRHGLGDRGPADSARAAHRRGPRLRVRP